MSKEKFSVAVVMDENFDNYDYMKKWLDKFVLPDRNGVLFASMGDDGMVKDYATKRKDAEYVTNIKADTIAFFWDGKDKEVEAMFKTAYKHTTKDFILFMYNEDEMFDRNGVNNGELKEFWELYYGI